MPVGKKAIDRITSQLRRYQSVVKAAKDRDISESDTAVIIGDILADVLGYEKYVEITTEFMIRGTYVDLAVKVGRDVHFLVEAKAIGVPLKDAHVKQAIDYGANHGIEWVVLSNATTWRIYRIEFKQPIGKTLVAEIDLLTANAKDPRVIECFANLSKEGFAKGGMADFFDQQQATSKYSIAAALLGERMINQLRLELRRLFPGVKVDEETLEGSLRLEVIKRELVEGEDAEAAGALLKRLTRSLAREKERSSKDSSKSGADASPPPSAIAAAAKADGEVAAASPSPK
ncbi:MAG: type I restriction enzyme HsdR N-terminal domain-containing protein [Alphaproteobacteria bacterium]|nr:type I restriction enzyme HsdR N-terminal domain-containing protein [Alphaproteobacteria bacterium]MCW5739098.1 type I restriction enzyme HsdR N-terminal domain-containing protein [Alphaproteobacteria bacterium]